MLTQEEIKRLAEGGPPPERYDASECVKLLAERVGVLEKALQPFAVDTGAHILFISVDAWDNGEGGEHWQLVAHTMKPPTTRDIHIINEWAFSNASRALEPKQ